MLYPIELGVPVFLLEPDGGFGQRRTLDMLDCTDLMAIGKGGTAFGSPAHNFSFPAGRGNRAISQLHATATD